jgi:hypothetical protein
MNRGSKGDVGAAPDEFAITCVTEPMVVLPSLASEGEPDDEQGREGKGD